MENTSYDMNDNLKSEKEAEARRNLDGLFSIAEEVSEELTRHNYFRLTYSFILIFLVLIGVFFISIFLINFYFNDTTYVGPGTVQDGSLFFFILIVIIYLSAFYTILWLKGIRKSQIEHEGFILKDVMLTISSILDNKKGNLSIIEHQTYTIRLRRLEFPVIGNHKKSFDGSKLGVYGSMIAYIYRSLF